MDRHGDTLVLGVQSMDEEHQHLTALFDEFVTCLKDEGFGPRARELVEQALVVTNAHFEHEEVLMAQNNYPGIEEEKFQHRLMRLHLTTLVGDVLNAGSCDPVTMHNIDTMRRLFTDHISGPDRELADFLIANGIT